MRTLNPVSDPARRRRIAKLSERFDFSEEMDAAAEFAALEGHSVADALAEFHRELYALPATGPDLRRHSMAVAHAARDLARLAGVDPEVAFTAGLVHDLGRPGGPEREWIDAGFPVIYAESLVYGIDHAAHGAELLRARQFPENIVEAVAMHHRPERSGSRLSAVLTLAEDFTARTANAPSEDLWPDMRRTAACLTTGIGLDRFEEFCSGHSRPDRRCA